MVTRHSTDIAQGIYESHCACLQKGIAHQARRFLVFEDDVFFSLSRCSASIMRDIGRFVTTEPHWNILFLGCMVKKSWPSHYPSIRGVAFQTLAHAYAINSAFAARILREYFWSGQPYDDFLRDLPQDGFYTVYPAIAFQSDASSDNKPYLLLDAARRALGGLARLQKMNEFFHCHRRLILALHALVILLVAALIFWC
ncbi:MAG: glycosyltransferase [Desulfobulbaceae bacterium]|nr:glycosyltransferase [Desulfobulbaceae bacterium]